MGRRLIVFGSPVVVVATAAVVWVALPAFAAQHSGVTTLRLNSQSLAQRARAAIRFQTAALVKREAIAETRAVARLKHERVAEARLIAAQVKQEAVAEARDVARLKPERGAEARDRRSCPIALTSSRLAIGRVASALRREVPVAFHDMQNQNGFGAWRGYRPVAIYSLKTDGGELLPRVVARYHKAAAAACGNRVASRSWVALIQFPQAGSALQGAGVAFLARTAAGWRIWGTTVVSELPRVDLLGP